MGMHMYMSCIIFGIAKDVAFVMVTILPRN